MNIYLYMCELYVHLIYTLTFYITVYFLTNRDNFKNNLLLKNVYNDLQLLTENSVYYRYIL